MQEANISYMYSAISAELTQHKWQWYNYANTTNRVLQRDEDPVMKVGRRAGVPLDYTAGTEKLHGQNLDDLRRVV
jgi:hypothetical protein